MRAAVRSVFSTDVDVDSYVSADAEKDGVLIRLIVGPADGPREESFDVLVCTPLWLREIISREGPQIGRHHLIVDPLDLRKATSFLRRQVESVEAADWPTLGAKLARIGHWEFEDYDTSNPHIDHAIPRSLGGGATLPNAQVACPHCNMSRGNAPAPVTPPEGYLGPWPPAWWPRQ